jgi:hypothetical protein
LKLVGFYHTETRQSRVDRHQYSLEYPPRPSYPKQKQKQHNSFWVGFNTQTQSKISPPPNLPKHTDKPKALPIKITYLNNCFLKFKRKWHNMIPNIKVAPQNSNGKSQSCSVRNLNTKLTCLPDEGWRTKFAKKCTALGLLC